MGESSKPVGKRDADDDQTPATALVGPLEQELPRLSTGYTKIHDTTEVLHTLYVRGRIEGTQINILVDSRAFISADFLMSIPALHKNTP